MASSLVLRGADLSCFADKTSVFVMDSRPCVRWASAASAIKSQVYDGNSHHPQLQIRRHRVCGVDVVLIIMPCRSWIWRIRYWVRCLGAMEVEDDVTCDLPKGEVADSFGNCYHVNLLYFGAALCAPCSFQALGRFGVSPA